MFANNVDKLIPKIEDEVKKILHVNPALSFDDLYQNVLTGIGELSGDKKSITRTEAKIKKMLQSMIKAFSSNNNELLTILKYLTSIAPSEFLQQSTLPKSIDKSSHQIKIAIVGTGPAGLLLAKSLEQLNCQITLYEQRSREESLSRFIFIAIKDGKRILQILGEKAFNYILMRGGAFEKESGILRVPISILQQAILTTLSNSTIIKYNYKIDDITSFLKNNTDSIDVCILATGAKTIAQFNMQNCFAVTEASAYQNKIYEMVLIEKSVESPTYWREFIPGKNWLVIGNTTDCSDKIYSHYLNIVGDVPIIDDFTEKTLYHLQSFLNYKNITLRKVKCADKSFISPINPVCSRDYDIIPSLTHHQIGYIPSLVQPIILIGDASGKAHPITISGAEKYLKVIPYITNLMLIYKIMQMADESKITVSEWLILRAEFEKLFHLLVQPIIENVFVKSLIFSMYTKFDR